MQRPLLKERQLRLDYYGGTSQKSNIWLQTVLARCLTEQRGTLTRLFWTVLASLPLPASTPTLTWFQPGEREGERERGERWRENKRAAILKEQGNIWKG